MKTRVVVPIALLAAAGMGLFALAQTSPKATTPPTNAQEPIITESGAPGQCAYTWAYKDLPEISREFQKEVREVFPEAEAHATAFGENCVHEDGSATFGAMQTDFYINIPVVDLTNDEALAKYIEQVLPIVDSFAPPRVPGPNDGFVEFTFRKGEERRILRVLIPLGRQLRIQGLQGIELIQALETE